MIDEFAVENGSHWKCRDPVLHEVIAQWLYKNVWVLMTAPYRAGPDSGPYHTAQMPLSDPDGSGKILYTRAELAERLNKYGYSQIVGRTVHVTDGQEQK